MKKVLSFIGNLIFVLLLVLAVLSVASNLQARRNPSKLQNIFGYTAMSILTGSMQPVLMPGDMIVVKATEPKAIKAQDIITYKEGDILITHRVMDVAATNEQLSFITKGDANNVEDPRPILAEHVVGVMALRIPFAGYAAKHMRSVFGFIILILLPVAWAVTKLMKTIVSELKNEKVKERDKMES